MQYHEVKIILEFRQKNECYVTADQLGNCGVSLDSQNNLFCVPSLEAASLYIDYIYLDTDERRRFAQVSHEYLIEQLQFTGDESITSQNVKVKLNFNKLLFNANKHRILSGGLSARGIEITFEEFRKKTKIEITAKSLRQSCIYKWLNKKVPETTIKEWLGLAPSYSLRPYTSTKSDNFFEEII